MESDLIQVQGDVRFIKRKVDISREVRNKSEKRLSHLESQINSIENAVGSMEMDLSSMDDHFVYIESDMDDLVSGYCDNIFLCRQKKF
ncbi:hypothetical protein UZ36_08015 [Candidatus Nitromaritima sp. SCGC AAA799-C22]|nr:hypothetical protein UZ36_08015 [Candidatus Nitromaritima sp. SCGC AAA799-C22]